MTAITTRELAQVTGAQLAPEDRSCASLEAEIQRQSDLSKRGISGPVVDIVPLITEWRKRC